MGLLEWSPCPPAIKVVHHHKKPLRPFGYWNRFHGFNQTVTGQLEEVDDGVGRGAEGREIKLKRGG